MDLLDLDGERKKKEIGPEGAKDEKVFDIRRGVSISLMVKLGRKEVDDGAR